MHSLRIITIAMMGYVMGGARPIEAPSYSEYKIKAAFLINFGRYVEFSEGAQTADTFNLCVLGRDPFGAVLDEAASSKTIHGKPLVIHRLRTPRELNSCHLVFLAASEMSFFDSMTGWAKSHGALTVGETRGFASRGGILNFVVDNGRVRFEVNPSAAASAHLRISSELLQLATLVPSHPEAR